MTQKAKGTDIIIIGRDANGTEIKINSDEFNAAIKQRVESMSEKFIKKSNYKFPEWLCILICSILGAILFIGAMILFQKCCGFEMDYENSTTIVLGFVGIATTFVVVSNYAQVKEIKNEFKTKLQAAKDEFSSQISQLTELKDTVANLDKKVKNIDVAVIEYKIEMIYSIAESNIFLSEKQYFSSLPTDKTLKQNSFSS